VLKYAYDSLQFVLLSIKRVFSTICIIARSVKRESYVPYCPTSTIFFQEEGDKSRKKFVTSDDEKICSTLYEILCLKTKCEIF
jgi:hypothetical protein